MEEIKLSSERNYKDMNFFEHATIEFTKSIILQRPPLNRSVYSLDEEKKILATAMSLAQSFCAHIDDYNEELARLEDEKYKG
jgi:hypothetical protein